MNTIKGIIKKINIAGLVSLIDVDCSGLIMRVLILQVPASFKEGDEAELFFKESEVLLVKSNESIEGIKKNISIENVVNGKIIKIKSGEIFTEVITGTAIGKIMIITETKALERLKITELSSVAILIKANSIGLGAIE